MTKISRFFLYFLLLIILLIGGLVLLVYSMDPSRLKPTLERELARRGIEAQFGGDIEWQFYPNIGLGVNALSLNPMASPDTEAPLMYVDSMAFSVQLLPLLRRQILINGINVASAKLNLVVDENGEGNWESLTNGETGDKTPEAPQPEAETALPEIEINELTLTDLALEYRDRRTQETFLVENFSVTASGFNLDGSAFPLAVSVNAAVAELPPTALRFNANVALNLTAQNAALSDARLQLASLRENAAGEAINLAFNSRVNWSDPLKLSASVNATPFNLRRVMRDFELADIPTQSPDALSQVALAFDLNYSPNEIAVTNVKATIDDTHLTGNTTLTSRTLSDSQQALDVPWQIESRWNGDSINLDNYLPPPSEPEPEPAATEAQPLPLDAVRSLSAVLGLTFEEVVVLDMTVNDLAIEVQAQNGLVTLETLTASTFDGEIAANGAFDARQEIPSLQLELDVESVNVGALAQHFTELDKLAGDAGAEVLISSRGETDQALLNNLDAQIKLASQNLRISPVNLQQQYCKLLATLDKRELEKTDWNAYTELAPVTLTARYTGNEVNLQSLDAAIEKLSAKATGSLNLETGRFNFPIDLSLADFSSGPEACGTISEKWRERAIPLRCRGNLSDIGADVCLPDTDRLGDMVKAAAQEKVEEKKQEVKEKVETKVEEEKERIEEKAKSKLEEELERLRERGLFGN